MSAGRGDEGDERFYATLGELGEFQEIADRSRYTDAPSSWHVVITDVQGSTAAIEAGRYRDVNALGVASIVALRNAAPDLELPYVFGGDGATLLVPSTRLDACAAALRGARRLARDVFGLELRAGVVPVEALRRAGHGVRVARFRLSPHVRLAMFAGSGFGEAERWVKHTERGALYAVSDPGEESASFEGFECRWQPVKSRRGEVVSLLVHALASDEQESARVYRAVIATLDELGGDGGAHPLTESGLRLQSASRDYAVEARVRSQRGAGAEFDRAASSARRQALVGRVLMGVGASAGGFDGRAYRRELVENTDFRKFDETLRMVLDLSPPEIDAVRAYLERERAARRLVFGMHQSPSALVTCFVRSYSGDHVHFVDGANGGYALAAKELKAQLAASDRTS